MAKVAFSKLDVKLCDEVKNIIYRNGKGEEISYEVKCYLPVEKKLDLIANVINQSIDDNGYYNPIRLKIFTVLEIVYAYTNLNFTEKQKENPLKLYDLLISNGIYEEIVNCIFKNDYEEIDKGIKDTIRNIYEYKNSVMGIFEAVTADYGGLDLDINALSSKLADPDNITLLKSIVTKLG